MKELIEFLRELAGKRLGLDRDLMNRAALVIEDQAATIARYETTAENYELLQAKVDEQAREIERQSRLIDGASTVTAALMEELAALKSKPSWVDERAAFEAAWPSISAELPSHQHLLYGAVDVEIAERNAAQEGWQARAALTAPAAGECVAVQDNKDNKINGFKDPILYFADINDPDETGTDEPDFCDVVLAEDYDRNINALLALLPNLYREPRK